MSSFIHRMARIFRTLFFTATFTGVLAGCASVDSRAVEDNSPIRVSAIAITPAEAKQNAFRAAIEQKGSAFILGQRTVENDNFHEKILNYSSGFIRKYQEVSLTRDGEFWTIVLDVWVKDSKIAGALIPH